MPSSQAVNNTPAQPAVRQKAPPPSRKPPPKPVGDKLALSLQPPQLARQAAPVLPLTAAEVQPEPARPAAPTRNAPRRPAQGQQPVALVAPAVPDPPPVRGPAVRLSYEQFFALRLFKASLSEILSKTFARRAAEAEAASARIDVLKTDQKFLVALHVAIANSETFAAHRSDLEFCTELKSGTPLTAGNIGRLRTDAARGEIAKILPGIHRHHGSSFVMDHPDALAHKISQAVVSSAIDTLIARDVPADVAYVPNAHVARRVR